jgi:hypothetical protein
VVCLAVGCKRGCTHVMGCRAFCEVSEPPAKEWWGSLHWVRQRVRHQESAGTSFQDDGLAHHRNHPRTSRNKHHITLQVRSAGRVVLRVCAFVCLYVFVSVRYCDGCSFYLNGHTLN